MSDSTLHIGALASNNIVNDAGKYDECKEKVKDLTKEIQTRKDIFEKMAEPLVYVCDCYQKFNVVTGMPKSTFGDSFGYDMQKDISSHMSDFYAGKVSRDELSSYFEECCTSMRTYRTSQHQTSGTNESDNTQIVSEMYEVFAKENARAASQANYQEGKALNEKNYSDSHSDWTYYNSDYYYQCNEINAALRKSVQQMTEKWNLDEIDCDKIEANSSLTLDGGFDFNSTWNFEFRNQAGRSSLAKESAIPPENFKMFFKEQVTSFTEDNKFNGNLKITMLVGHSKLLELLLKQDRLTASYCVAIWKMLRKKGCVPSALTQNVKDFLASPEIENIFENSDFLVLLSQAQGDRQILAKQLGISPHQLSYVTHTNSGEGLLFFGNTTIPFVDRFPQNTELYAIMTTRPEDKKQEMNRA